ncbi:putative basic proline-rich protein [Roseibium sp. TrichSKD4]|uniref:flagellar biosynthetic protein FliO n=1 Tax=Roseibium sp. TrichSKD4 TaxID=744980 RepID=UPI0001E56A39|nr:flagellar biosynthetic protein FliO [Roseibium sp. TrichSKD4]EFO30755.1 putative basic proline-rich protein [Roseibium sp. TrichSKD4]
MYEWIEQTLGVGDGIARILAFSVSLIVVLALFGLFVVILKRLMGSSMPGQRNRQPRIQIMDAASLDPRRRLVLVRRDNVEHLILIGGTNDVVVEQSIVRNAPLGAHNSRQIGLAAGPGPLPEPKVPEITDELPAPKIAAEGEPAEHPAKAKLEAAIERKRAEKSVEAEKTKQLPTADQLATARSRPSSNRSASDNKIATIEKPASSKAAASLVRAAANSMLNSRRDKTDPITKPETEKKDQHLSLVSPLDAPLGTDAKSADAKAKAAPDVKPDIKVEQNATETEAAASPLDAELFEPEKSEAPETDKSAATPNRFSAFASRRATDWRQNESRPAPKITPPASGPAARARTAFLNTGTNSLSDASTTEKDNTGSSNPANDQTLSSSLDKEETNAASEATKPTNTPAISRPTFGKLTTPSNPETKTPGDDGASKEEQAAQPERAMAEASVTSESVVMDDEVVEAKTTEEPIAEDLTKESEEGLSETAANLDDDDVVKSEVDPENPETRADVAMEKAEKAAQQDAEEKAKQKASTETKTEAKAGAIQSVEKPAFRTTANLSSVSAGPRTATAQAHSTPIEINPIEAEMEKLLDEINGPRN